MEAPDFSASYGLSVLLDDIKADDPQRIVEALYGPEYREGLRDCTNHDVGWHHGKPRSRPPLHKFYVRGHPKPQNLADFLAAVVVDEIAHDGSERNRQTRTPGWWFRDSNGVWRPTSLQAICTALHGATRQMLEAARLRCESERLNFDRAEHAAMLPPAIDSIYGLLGGGASRLASVAAIWREDARFALPPEAADALLAGWFREAAAEQGWRPGLRVPPAHVWAAYRLSGGPFLKHDFFERLDNALGPEGCRTRGGFRVPDALSDKDDLDRR